MLPVLRAFLDAHKLSDVTVVADAGMVSEANNRAIEAAGLSFIPGARIPDVPYAVTAWRDPHPDADIPDGQAFAQPRRPDPATTPRLHVLLPVPGRPGPTHPTRYRPEDHQGRKRRGAISHRNHQGPGSLLAASLFR